MKADIGGVMCRISLCGSLLSAASYQWLQRLMAAAIMAAGAQHQPRRNRLA